MGGLGGGGGGVEGGRTGLDRARAPIEAKRRTHESELRQLSARWDQMVDAHAPDSESREVLGALRQRVQERTYISNLLEGIERELAQ